MRTNGQLFVETRTAGGVNEWGEPLGDNVRWSDTPVECLVTPNSDTRMERYEDGEFRQAAYSVLVEGSGFEAERIKLVCGNDTLGEFRVISIQPLTVGRTKIIV